MLENCVCNIFQVCLWHEGICPLQHNALLHKAVEWLAMISVCSCSSLLNGDTMWQCLLLQVSREYVTQSNPLKCD